MRSKIKINRDLVSTGFPALGTGFASSRSWYRSFAFSRLASAHVFLRLAPVRVFPRLARIPRLPALRTDCTFFRAWHECMFPRAWRRLYVFVSNSHWFTALSRLLCLAIKASDYYGLPFWSFSSDTCHGHGEWIISTFHSLDSVDHLFK